MGTEASGRAFRIGTLLLVGVGTFTLSIRVMSVIDKRRSSR
jgi:hypothetical protein